MEDGQEGRERVESEVMLEDKERRVPRELCETGDGSEQRVEPDTEAVDLHPDKGLNPGSSKDGLGPEVVTEEKSEDGRSEEGEEARSPVKLPAPVYVSKAEREEHELTPYLRRPAIAASAQGPSRSPKPR